MDIIDSTLIVSDVQNNGIREIVIKKDNPTSFNGITRLSDVLSALPCGLVHKEETGMGATSLELTTQRNSIVVEPIKVTASSKAYKHNGLYVGSETRFHTARTTKRQIKDFIGDPHIQQKKIVVVADSLQRVIEGIGESVFEEYFLLVDEADSFQLDSTYRKSMEECLDYYKMFNSDKRALLSSTLLDFSDPDLNEEPVTSIRYDVQTKRDIDVMITSNFGLTGTVGSKIMELLHSSGEDKIMVAYNSVTGCYNIAEHLIRSNYIQAGEIGILCSSNSKEKVNDYYRELENEYLPCKVNFVTSAYFTGFDLMERYHLISVSGNTNKVHALSEKRLKQIAGRCRVRLLSETIIHDTVPNNVDMKVFTKDEIIAASEIEIETINCIRRHFDKSDILKLYYNKITNQVLTALESENRRFIRYNENNNSVPVISYLNIDAFLENNRVRSELYLDPNALSEKLSSQGHELLTSRVNSAVTIDRKDIDKVHRSLKVRQIVSFLRDVAHESELRTLELTYDNLTILQKTIVGHFRQLYQYIEPGNLLDKINETADDRDSRKLNNLVCSATFVTYPDAELFKSRVLYYFPVGQLLYREQILDRWNHLFVEANISSRFQPGQFVGAVRLTKLFFECRKLRSGVFQILRTNPENLVVLKQRESVRDMTIHNAAISILNHYLHT